jgi:hypothetical protein
MTRGDAQCSTAPDVIAQRQVKPSLALYNCAGRCRTPPVILPVGTKSRASLSCLRNTLLSSDRRRIASHVRCNWVSVNSLHATSVVLFTCIRLIGVLTRANHLRARDTTHIHMAMKREDQIINHCVLRRTD